MIELYKHQRDGVKFLVERSSAGLFWEMGLGKSRAVLVAARQLFEEKKIDRVLILVPAAVRIVWNQEIAKLNNAAIRNFVEIEYEPDSAKFIYRNVAAQSFREWGKNCLPVVLVSYALLPRDKHSKAIYEWCRKGNTLIVADESSFLKSRNAKQTRKATKISSACKYRWLLTGTPIANSPVDLYGQTLVMMGQRATISSSFTRGPLKGFCGYTHFQARYAETIPMRFGGGRVFRKEVGTKNLEELQQKFAPYVSRIEKKDALDLPPKSYTVREVALDSATWSIYMELKREAMLCLPDSEERPEPNAAVRILRLAQLTSGHVGTPRDTGVEHGNIALLEIDLPQNCTDISSEKLSWLVEAILDGELSNERALIVWCRWRRERERLAFLLEGKIPVYEIYGGQSDKLRAAAIESFQLNTPARRVLLAQPHAGGYGLTLTAASIAVYLSNTFSYIDRVQSEDRQHRIGQAHPCLYIDVVATGPRGQRTIDAHILECLREKKNVAETTCAAWREVLAQ